MAGASQAAHMVRSGFAGVVADMQHGTLGYDAMAAMMGSVAGAGGIPAMRPPLEDFGMAARGLDAGASVIIMPMINSLADANKLASVTKYPPLASRSFGPVAAASIWNLSGPEYLACANDCTTVLAMIETEQAIACLDDILGVDGIDGVFVGPYDLSISLSGGKMEGANDPGVVSALPEILAAANKHEKIAGIYASGGEQSRTFAELGYKLISASSDGGLIAAGAKAVLEAI
jgi:4-hydroxy-2-oxoheptanedioate aldolase